MDFLVILIVVIIVLNVLNTAIQKAREGRQDPPVRVVRKTSPEPEEAPREYFRSLRDERRRQDEEPERTGEGKTFEPDAVRVTAARQVEAASPAQAAAVTTNLERMLTSKDDLVAAFIFHEILERPRSLRRRQ